MLQFQMFGSICSGTVDSHLRTFKDLKLIGENSYLTTGLRSSICGSKLIFGHCDVNFLSPKDLQSEHFPKALQVLFFRYKG